ncbi:MAG: Crp/Fnr family transcriptional regulator [Acidiferrobacterales bacterium]|nr:Crp/Fnr family transcriptional regulator [Acidiferrobacterales bacterium]
MNNTTEIDQNAHKLSFSDSWIERFDQYAITKSYTKGTLIFSEGDESDGMFLIQEGQVKVFMSDESGKEMLIALLGAGEIVGEVASLDGQPRTASVAAVQNTKVAKIGINEFRQFIEENADMALEIIHVLTARIRDHATSISNLAFKNVYGRVVWLLEKHSEQNPDGTFTVNRRFTQQDIADMVGSSREMVSRVVSELVKGEYISIDHKIITIQKALPRGW